MKTVKEFVEAYKAKKFMNTKQGADERIEWIRKELEIKSYIPFREKREIAEMIVKQNMTMVDGIKKYDDIGSYVSLVVASIVAHTTLVFGDDPVVDYDLLAESGLLAQIVSEFQGSHDEIGILLKMAVAAELEDNNVNALVGRFLDGILKKLEGLSGVLNGIDLNAIFKDENLAKFIGLLNK